jgi:ABC-type branched-subunit amino acid transport system substrate-binding protein
MNFRSTGRTIPHRCGLALLLALSACQSNGTVSDVLDPAAVDQSAGQADAPGTIQPTLTLGKGSTKIAMLLPLSAGGNAGEKGRKMLDGARLAMEDLGNELITLTIDDTNGDSARAKDLALKAMGSGARAVIGPQELAAVERIAALSGPTRVPVLALAENFEGAPSVYVLRLNEADSAAAGAAAIAEQGKRKFVLLVPRGAAAQKTEKRVANSLSIYGASLAVTVPYGPVGGIEKAVADMAAVVEAPEAIVVVSGDASPLPILAALKAKGFSAGSAAVIGTSRWLERPLDDPLLQGTYVAALDTSETGPIASRFKARFGYDPDVQVAYAYDAVALSAGIASAVGPDGFSRKVLENRNGFRGTTGLFRFRPDGGSERSMPFYRIENGRLKQIVKSTSSF